MSMIINGVSCSNALFWPRHLTKEKGLSDRSEEPELQGELALGQPSPNPNQATDQREDQDDAAVIIDGALSEEERNLLMQRALAGPKEEMNDHVRLIEFSGLPVDFKNMPSQDAIREALLMMKTMAEGAKGAKRRLAKNYFFQANLNPTEVLNDEQWEKSVEILEKHLGLSGCPRFIVEHEKKGRIHRHVIWSRVNPLTNEIVSDRMCDTKCRAAAREIERELGLSKFEFKKNHKAPKEEHFQNRANVKDEAIELSAIFNASISGEDFQKKLLEKGYVLCRGTKSDALMIVNKDGHSGLLSKRLRYGGEIPEAAIQEKLADLSFFQLPCVDDVMMETILSRPAGPMIHAIRECFLTETPAEIAKGLVDAGFNLVRVSSRDVEIRNLAIQRAKDENRRRLPAPIRVGQRLIVDKHGKAVPITKFTTGALPDKYAAVTALFSKADLPDLTTLRQKNRKNTTFRQYARTLTVRERPPERLQRPPATAPLPQRKAVPQQERRPAPKPKVTRADRPEKPVRIKKPKPTKAHAAPQEAAMPDLSALPPQKRDKIELHEDWVLVMTGAMTKHAFYEKWGGYLGLNPVSPNK